MHIIHSTINLLECNRMATDLDHILQVNEPILYVKRRIGDKIEYFGYRFEYVSQNLTEIERNMLTCPECRGIVREAVVVKERTVCLKCSGLSESVRSVQNLRENVNQLRIKCPSLDGCKWTGVIREVISHIYECSYVCEECPDKCGIILPRKAIDFHLNSNCVLRRITCEYCNTIFQAKDANEHNQICKDFPVKCPNGCGKEVVMKKFSHHKEKCPLADVGCSLGCGNVNIKRGELHEHKNEFIIKHQDLLSKRLANLEKRMEAVIFENEDFKKEIGELKFEMKTKVDLEGVNWSIPRSEILEKSQNMKSLRGLVFTIGRYKFMGIAKFQLQDAFKLLYNISFFVQRIIGGYDEKLAPITSVHCRAILINEENKVDSEIRDSYLEFNGKVGQISQCLAKFEGVPVYCEYIRVRLYIEINPSPKLEGSIGNWKFSTLKI